MKFKTFILDLDGTVYVDGKPIGDIIMKLNNFRSKGNRVIYLSNNTTVGRNVYYQKLNKLGLKVPQGDIITPISVAGDYLKKRYSKGFLVGTKSLMNELENAFQIYHENDDPEFVLLAFDTELTYEKLRKACVFINRGIPYFITHIDLACPSEKGPIPDCGSISLLVESVTGKKPLTDFGKPSKKMADFINQQLGAQERSEVLMAGDRLYTDIALGNIIGAQTLIVFSGETKKEDLIKSKGKYKIDFYAETLAGFIESNMPELTLKQT